MRTEHAGLSGFMVCGIGVKQMSDALRYAILHCNQDGDVLKKLA